MDRVDGASNSREARPGGAEGVQTGPSGLTAGTESTYRCVECGFSVWHTIRTLSASVLGLYDDARFPGRCLLVLATHYEDPLAVPERLMEAFIRDAAQAAEAIRAVTGAPRLNYAILGNTAPHIHCHLIPRGLAEDPAPLQSPWATGADECRLDVARRQQLAAQIATRIAVS
jgi:diadenosine tetraphosphate (Ap4A) HIT family hydrolase